MKRPDGLHARAWQVQSLLLGYPDDTLFSQLPLLRRATATLPVETGAPLLRLLDHLDARPATELAEQYVATFDHRRRCCLYLTYYTHGDTRKRGIALLKIKHRYTAARMPLLDGELPDHLAVVLEFAAAHPTAGLAILTDHRAGVELLRLALHDAASPWAPVLDSLATTLPRLTGDQRQAAARLAAAGPPGEEVGLEPFGPPEFMPPTTPSALSPSPGGRR